MRRLVLTIPILALALAACSPAAPPPSAASPSWTPASPSAPPSAAPSPSPARPEPDPTAGAGDSPPPIVFTAQERFLRDGVRRGAIDCSPVRAALPDRAISGIECRSDDPHVARVGFYLFASDADMLATYFHRLREEGIEPDSGGCDDGEGEGPYIPEEGIAPDRRGCFVNDQGYANFRATVSGTHLYVGVLGRTPNMRALAEFASRDTVDVPGAITLWADPDS